MRLSSWSGHSERRTHFSETSEIVALKIRAALNNNLKVILCIGETLTEREAGTTTKVVQGQLQAVVKVTEESDWRSVEINLYNPYYTDLVISKATSLLHTNQCGLLARAKSPRLRRLRKLTLISELIWTKNFPSVKPPVSSMVVAYPERTASI